MNHSRYISLKGILAFIFGVTTLIAGAQTIIEDTFSLGSGYEDMAFYSLENGVVAQSPLADWHIALDVRPMGSGARINCGTGMTLYYYGGLENWLTVNLDTWDMPDPLRNDQSDWANAAFNQGGDGMFDLGWGIYDIITHEVHSDKMYLIQFPDGTWKQFAILSLVSGTYTYQVADVGGDNELLGSVSKSDYEGKLFAYCNITSGEAMDLEPDTPWDFVFHSYVEDLGGGTYYGVVGALAHPDATVQQVDGLQDPFTDGDFDAASFSMATNEVGYDWKTYSPGSGYVLESERCYFVSANDQAIWRMVMTEFGGSATGDITLGKVEVSGSNVNPVINTTEVLAYPNPVMSGRNITLEVAPQFENAHFNVRSLAGSVVMSFTPTAFPYRLNTSNLKSGYYLLESTSSNGQPLKSRFIVQ
ncbi:MAG: hypothetical protein CL834_04945 [Crocinitomicaceae bacterium]|nr:hypothetical protein [Crocinitomicaceae bacterium]